MKAFKLVTPVAILTSLFTAQAAMAQFSIGASDDTWVREDNPTSNRNGNDQMNARTDIDVGADDNDVILLRFPTASLTGTESLITLNLHWQRTDGSDSNELQLWGLNESDPDETSWSETTVTYNTAPGMLPDGLTPDLEYNNLLRDYDDVRDLDIANLTDLGTQGYGPAVINEIYTFSSPALTAFINADSNGEVSFLITRGNISGSGNQARFWPKESGPSPFLFVPEPSTFTLLGLGGLALMLRRRA
jgi:hypothetical protein